LWDKKKKKGGKEGNQSKKKGGGGMATFADSSYVLRFREGGDLEAVIPGNKGKKEKGKGKTLTSDETRPPRKESSKLKSPVD